MIKKQILAIAVVTAALFGACVSSYAASGTFGSYISVNINSAGVAFKGCAQPGPNFLPAFNGLNLGTVSTLSINGGELLTFKNGASDVTGANLNWRVDANAFQAVALGFTSNATFADAAGNSFSNGGDQKWAQIASTPNVLTGVGVGTHTLEVFFDAPTNIDGTQFSNNGGANFKATFTVIPEPSTVSLLLGSSIMGGLFLLRRKRA